MSEDNEKGYGCFVMFISGVALLIALIALRKWDGCLTNITSDITVTDILSILVTVLIAGQLWQSYVTKEDLKRVDQAVTDVRQLKDELTQARELPHGIMWSLRAVRSQAEDTIQGNRLAIKFYTESLKHLVLAQADYNDLIRDSLVGMRNCISNIRNADVSQFMELSDEILVNINAAEESISQMTMNLREAFREIEEMRNIHRVAASSQSSTEARAHS